VESGLPVLTIAVEMSPLAKVGGLADVVGALPHALRHIGIDARVAMPLHGVVDREAYPLRPLAEVPVSTPSGSRAARLLETSLRGVPVYLVEDEAFFGRPSVYGDDEDDLERWLYFCDAVLAAAPHLIAGQGPAESWRPAVLHLHDWHAAFVGSRLLATTSHPWASCARVYTIHNLALQGLFDEVFSHRHGLPLAALIAPDGQEPDVAFSGMAQGILWSDVVSTVSPTYAREIQTPELGAGLDALLRSRSDRVTAVLNGIDYELFDPARDPSIAANYDAETLDRRTVNKKALQERTGLPVRSEIPLAGMVSRLYEQKGTDLVAPAFRRLLAERDLQLVVLGTGDPAHEEMLSDLQAEFPTKAAAVLRFDEELAQLIYAGCDFFLMPSRFEPCGLGQLIALRYGAVPVVRRTGGLVDTVQDCDAELKAGTGFVFEAASAHELEHAIERALAAHADQAGWRRLQMRGMSQDFSWHRAAGSYSQMYEHAVGLRQAAASEALERSGPER
jgi:starch synthase